MKRKKKINSILTYILTGILCLVVLLIPVFSYNGFWRKGAGENAVAEANVVEPTVSLQWLSTTDSNGVAYSSESTKIGSSAQKAVLTARLYLTNAVSGVDVKVKVQTYDISARAKTSGNAGDYDAIDTTYTLSAANTSQTINVTIYRQIDFGVSGEQFALTAMQYFDTTRDVAAKIFGLRIVSVEKAIEDQANNSLIAEVLNDSSKNILYTTNKTFSHYAGRFDEGKSFSSVAVEYNSNFQVDDTDLSPKQEARKTFSDITDVGSKDLDRLQGRYGSELDYYYKFQGNVLSSCWNATGITIKVWDESETLYSSEWSEPEHKGSGSHYDIPSEVFDEDEISKGVSHELRGADTEFNKYFKYNGTVVTFYVKNRSLSTVHRDVNNWSYSLLIDNNVKPTVKGYRVANGSYGYGDDVYIAVDFSKHVQVHIPSGGSLKLRGSIGNKQVVFDYYGGSLTDTLVFRKSFDGTEEYNGSQIKIENFESTGDAQIYDLFMNGNNANNAWTRPVGSTSNPLATLNCSVDTRSPSVGTNYSSSQTLRSHTVPIEVSNVSSGARMDICWTTSDSLSSVTQWNAVPFYADSTTNVTGSNYTGNMYLHVRVTSASGRQTIKTFGPYKFDNNPPSITSITTADARTYQKSHNVEVVIKNYEDETYVSKVYFYAKDMQGNYVAHDELVYNSDSSSNKMTNASGDTYTLNATWDMVGLSNTSEVAGEAYGEFRIGFKVVDSLGNESNIVYSNNAVAFDTRETFEASVTPLNPDAFDVESIDGQEIIIVDGKSNSNYTFTLSAIGAGYENLTLKSFTKNGTTVSGSSIQSGNTEFDVGGWSATGNSSQGTVTLTFLGTAEGYYDTILQANEKESKIIRLIFSNVNSTPQNYLSFYAEDRLLINEVWRFATNYFYKYGADPVKYVEVSPDKNPIFSSKDKALEYAKFMEYQDMKPIVLSASQANQLESGTNSEFMKATVENGESVTAAAGQIWIRYKSANWTLGNSSYNSASSWVYYYYGDGSGVATGTTPVISDVTKIPAYLEDAVTVNAKKICGYDGEPYYLTANNGHQSDGQALSYEKKAIFFDPLTYTEGFSVPVKYTGDPDIYDGFVTVTVDGNAEEIAYLDNGTVSFENGYGALYYRLHGTEEYFAAYSGENLYNLVNITGVYEIVELGKGYKSYYIYIDKSEPILFYDFTHQNSLNATVSYLDKNIEGSVFNAKAVTLKGILYGENSVAGYTSEVDEYAYVYVMNANGNVLLDFMTMQQLHQMEDGYKLSSGTYQIYVYDRLGNKTYMTIRVNDEQIEVTSQIRENSSITFHFNRRLTEIREETFEIYRDGIKLDVSYDESLTFKESGTYRIKLTDIYGYSIDQEFEFTRDYPELRFYYVENGRFQEVIPVESDDATAVSNQSVKVIKNADNSYLVVSAEDIRITYDNHSDYLVRTSKGTPVIKQGGLNSVTLDIEGGEEDWEIEIAYVSDPLVYVSVTCSYDVEEPLIETFGTVKSYDFNDLSEEGADNVLFSSTENRIVPIQNGERINTDAVTVHWTDENSIRAAYYIKHGEEETRVEVSNPSVGEYTVRGYGDYTFYVVDIIGNTAEFSFKLAETIDVAYMIGEEEVKFKTNPLDYIEDGVYMDTQYTGDAVRLLFTNYGHLAFVWSDGVDTYLYYVDYNNGEVVISYRYGENGEEEEVVNTITNFDSSGTLMTEPFRINYGKEGDIIYVEYPKPESEYVFWQIRLSDTKYVSPVILQIVQSNNLPNVQLEEADGTLVQANEKDFVGVNSELNVVKSSVTEDIVSVVAYRSDVYTMDFDEAEEFVLYDGSSYQQITEHGYYKIVATNIYGNQQIMMIRLSFELDINILINYADGEQRTYTLGTEKEQSFKSNKAISFSVWDLECQISVKRNGVKYEPVIDQKAGYFYFELKEYGEYVITALDSCGNLYTLDVSVKAPATVEYNGYLTDFNEDALYKDKFYSNAPVSIDLNAVESGEIGYIAYAYTGSDGKKGSTIVLYDVISQEEIGYGEENFLRSIGKEGNGVYEVTFSDFYGNKTTIIVRISTVEQLVITRRTQSNVSADPWTLEDALKMGVWSNRLVTLTDNAQVSRLLVDGEEVAFVNGRYVLEYPTMTTEEDVQRQVVYVDEYGNKYAFTVHLYRKTPEPTFSSKKELVDVNGESRVQGEFSYVWDEAKVSAKYSLDMGEEQGYISGQILTEDGVYAFTFTDIAGNTATRTVTIDTKVVYTLKSGATTVANGITVNSGVSLYEDGEELTIVKVEKDGEVLETDDYVFVEHGSYKLWLQDGIGNETEIEFTIFMHAVNSFAYVAHGDYSITQVWYEREEGMQSLLGDVVMDETETKHMYEFKVEGRYEIELYHHETGENFSFSVIIDDTSPQIELIGVEEGGITRKNITFKGLEKGDVVEIYKGKKLIQRYQVEADGMSPEIKTAGNYRVVITDEAGNSVEYTFTREFTTNVASNLFILLLLTLTAAGGFIYLVLRDKNKVK